MRRYLALLVLVVTARPPAHANAESLAGRWHLVFYGKCVLTATNAHACGVLQAPAWFAVYSHPGATLVVRGLGDYRADSRGRYTVRFVTTITEHVPGARPISCANSTVFDEVWNGTCREIGTGHGRIAPGATGMDDFWQTDTQGYWTGSHEPFATSGATDTFNPACPGRLGTAAFLRLFGIRHVPSGIEAQLVLTHHP